MTNPYSSPQSNDLAGGSDAGSTRATLAFILPLIVFLVIGSFYPDFTESAAAGIAVSPEAFRYAIMVGVQIVIAACLLTYFRKYYISHFPWRWSWLSVVVGVVGVVLWIVLSELQIEKKLLTMLGMPGLLPNRPSFNPFAEFSDVTFRAIFLALRFTLLALIVPIVEELFLRGWLVRWMEDPDWEPVRLNHLSWAALATATGYGVLTHPAEAIAAIVWFSLVTWLMHRTGNLWDCIIAHAVTNFLLGLYVVQAGAWHLW